MSSTEVVRHFGDVLAGVKHTGESVVVTKGDKPVARLAPLNLGQRGKGSEIMAALARLPHDPDFAADLGKVNLSDRPLDNPWA